MIAARVLCATVCTLLLIGASASAAPADSEPSYPVIMVPGLGGGLPEIAPVADRLEAEGFEVLYFSEFDYIQSNLKTARNLADRVKEVAAGSGKVHIACFSAGVVSCRYAMKYLGIQELVERLVMYAGGNGSKPMCLLPVWAGGDNCAYHWFALSLEWGDDTPGDSEYYLITSFPELFTPIPDGGICYHYIPFDGTFRHPFEPLEPVYQDAVAMAMHGDCPGEFVDLPITNSSIVR